MLTDGLTDTLMHDGQKVNPIAHPEYSSGELKPDTYIGYVCGLLPKCLEIALQYNKNINGTKSNIPPPHLAGDIHVSQHMTKPTIRLV